LCVERKNVSIKKGGLAAVALVGIWVFSSMYSSDGGGSALTFWMGMTSTSVIMLCLPQVFLTKQQYLPFSLFLTSC